MAAPGKTSYGYAAHRLESKKSGPAIGNKGNATMADSRVLKQKGELEEYSSKHIAPYMAHE
jgi:hypothetical protein